MYCFDYLHPCTVRIEPSNNLQFTLNAPRYGLVNNKPCLERLEPPPGSGGVSQAAATPRYILAVTQGGQCWTHEEGKVGHSTLLTLMNIDIGYRTVGLILVKILTTVH